MPNAITGINDTLLGHLDDSMRNARSIRMIIGFLMESGARLLGDQLLAAAQRGVKIQILTGTYMAVTEPSAIYYLWEKLGSQVENYTVTILKNFKSIVKNPEEKTG